MKHVRFMFIALFAISFSPMMAQHTCDMLTDSIQVNGACGMCKSRIEKNLKMEGISSVNWNTDTKILIVSYDPGKITNDAIQKKRLLLALIQKSTAQKIVFTKNCLAVVIMTGQNRRNNSMKVYKKIV